MLAKNITLLDEVIDIETVFNCRALHFYSLDYHPKENSTIYNLTINSDSSSASTLDDATIGYHNTAEK